MYTESIGTKYLQSGISNEESGEAAKPKKELGKDDFLKLLVTQLKFQDPFNPMQSQEFSAQLAQFSSLEQLFGINKTLTEIQESLASGNDENLTGYIGRTVKTSGDTVSVSGGVAGAGAYSLSEEADVNISIRNGNGAEIRNIQAGKMASGDHSVAWDGLDKYGKKVGDGVYSLVISAVDQDGGAVSADIYNKGEVTGVKYQDGVSYLMVGKNLVTPEQIVEITK